MTIDRRTLVTSGASLALLAGLSHASAIFARPLGANPFTLGVAAGDPWPDGFVIWTRLAPRPLDEHAGMPQVLVPVTWEVSEDAGFTRVVSKGETLARPELGHSVHVELRGLRPHRAYWYRFSIAGSDISPVGTARTAPAAGAAVDQVRIAVAGCQNWEDGYFDVWGALAREPDLDLVFHYGDYFYEGKARPIGGRIVRQHVGDTLYSIDDYRRRYAQYKTDPHLQAAHQASAFAVSFDDHEIQNNWASDFAQDGTPPELFQLRRLGALQAWYENMPVRRAQLPGLGGMTAFRRLDYGRLLRTHVLDTRSYRSDQPCEDVARSAQCTPEAHIGQTMLGARQEAWLDDGLRADVTWNLLAQQVIVMPFDVRLPGQDKPLFETDLWDGYRPARNRLRDSIRNNRLTNVVIASGDHHKHAVGTVPDRDDAVDGKQIAVEFLTSSITSGGDGVGEKGNEHIPRQNPNMQLYTDRRGYQLFHVTPKQWITDVKVMDRVETSGGKIETLARYRVTPESARVDRMT